MGIDITLFPKLADLARRYRPAGRSVMLGRQGFQVKPHHRLRVNRTLRMTGHDLRWRDIAQPDGYSETLWRGLGFGGIEAMDLSDYEGATILHDLNLPVGPELHGQFDFVFDGGTIEHVFDVPTALANVFHMLRPGGRFVSANGMNGWVGHGLYQFNPEMVWSFWKRRCGCIVHECTGLPKDDGGTAIAFEDIADHGTRVRLNRDFPSGRVYLYYDVEKPPGAAIGPAVPQADYARRHADHAQITTARGQTGHAVPDAPLSARIAKQIWRAAKQSGQSR